MYFCYLNLDLCQGRYQAGSCVIMRGAWWIYKQFGERATSWDCCSLEPSNTLNTQLAVDGKLRIQRICCPKFPGDSSSVLVLLRSRRCCHCWSAQWSVWGSSEHQSQPIQNLPACYRTSTSTFRALLLPADFYHARVSSGCLAQGGFNQKRTLLNPFNHFCILSSACHTQTLLCDFFFPPLMIFFYELRLLPLEKFYFLKSEEDTRPCVAHTQDPFQ